MIPNELIKYNQWVVWNYETVNTRITKVPYAITGRKASTIDSTTWSPYVDAIQVYNEGHADGIGFVFTKNDPFIGIDWDHCVVDGKIDETVREEVKSIGSYAELSPSGTGIHVICKGKLPRTDRCRGNNREVYDHGRFFTVTGNHLLGTFADVYECCVGSLDHIFEMIAPKFEPPTAKASAFKYTPITSFSNENARDIFKKCAEGEQKQKFKKLMSGDISDYPSHSEADLALCNIIAEVTDNTIIIDFIFRNSKLFREKWDRSRNGISYGCITINSALHGKFMKTLRGIIEADET